MLSLGMKPLDELLRGGVEEGSSVAFVGSIENDNVILMHQAVLRALESGRRVLLVDFRQPPGMLFREMRSNGIDYSLHSDSITVLDGYSNLYGQNSHGKNVLPNPHDLGITTAIIKETLQSGNYDLLVVDDVTAQYTLQSNRKAYVKAVVRLVNSVKSMGRTTFVALYPDVFERPDLAAMLTPFDYILEVGGGVVRVRRSLQPPRFLEPEVPYLRTSEGIRPAHGRNLKERLRVGEDGSLWLEDGRVVLLGDSALSALVETLRSFSGEWRDVLYRWGRALERLSDGPDDWSPFPGGGSIVLEELHEDRAVFSGRNLVPSSAGGRAHPHYAGFLAKLLSESTGEPWVGEETRCEADGAESCEFVLRRVAKPF